MDRVNQRAGLDPGMVSRNLILGPGSCREVDNCKFHLDDTKLARIGRKSALAIGLIVLLLDDALHISGSLLKNAIVFAKESRLNWPPLKKVKYPVIAIAIIPEIFYGIMYYSLITLLSS